MMKDLHQSLRIEHVSKAPATRALVNFLVGPTPVGKAKVVLSLHASPNQFPTAGVQTPDFFVSLGFERLGPFSFIVSAFYLTDATERGPHHDWLAVVLRRAARFNRSWRNGLQKSIG